VVMQTRTNEEWLADLQASGERQESALNDLRQIIQGGLPYALNKWLSNNDPRLQPLVEEATQDTLLRVLDRLDTFEGRSQFTTWVHKIAVRIALTELRRKRWENVSLDDLVQGEDRPPLLQLMADPNAATPETIVEGEDLMKSLQRIIAEELTEKQRQALIAIVIKEMPLEEVARRMGSNRNAMYKLLHDARLRLKRRLAQDGLSPGDVLATFEDR
jgi:RNA polymerase sigma-70 factor (ECF subfamily)